MPSRYGWSPTPAGIPQLGRYRTATKVSDARSSGTYRLPGLAGRLVGRSCEPRRLRVKSRSCARVPRRTRGPR